MDVLFSVQYIAAGFEGERDGNRIPANIQSSIYAIMCKRSGEGPGMEQSQGTKSLLYAAFLYPNGAQFEKKHTRQGLSIAKHLTIHP